MSGRKEFEKKIKELLREIFIEKCHVDEASMTEEEEDSIRLLDGNEAIENLRDIFKELIAFKREYVRLDKAELIKRSEQFEGMLQKLEAEVRNHISVEHQLKLHIENNQSQTEELEIQNHKYTAQIRELNEKIKNLAKGSIERKESKDSIEKIGKLESIVVKKDATIRTLEAEIIKLKKQSEQGTKENNKSKGEIKNGKGKNEELEEIKQKFEEKAVDLLKIEQILREKSTPKPMKERNRSLRKSINDNEVGKHKIGESKYNVKINSRSHSRSTSDQVRPLSGIRKRA